MPRGVPNKPKTLDPAAISHAHVDQYTARAEEPTTAVRSREEQDAAAYTAEFLKNNRPDLSAFERKLAYYGEKAGWVRYWALDQGSRLQNLLARGWRFVNSAEVGMSTSVNRGNTDIGDQVSTVTTSGDGPVRQVLMEIPKALKDMYDQARTAPARATEEAIRAGAFKVDDAEHAYNPGDMRGSAYHGTHNRIESKPA